MQIFKRILFGLGVAGSMLLVILPAGAGTELRGVSSQRAPSSDNQQREVIETNPKGVKTECVFIYGTSVLVSNFVASFIRRSMASGAVGDRTSEPH
jgi:hypothetical protein